ncbi:MAG: hypothetical protein K8R41_03525 [Bacteroidales bacterium]|nr:hypothetical protein [Bacteroidales bacterium]
MINKFKKDSMIFGVIMGLLLPLIFYVILNKGIFLIKEIFVLDSFISNNKLMLISIFINLFTLRYYFVTLKYEQSGRGILLVTFIYIIAYFLFL